MHTFQSAAMVSALSLAALLSTSTATAQNASAASDVEKTKGLMVGLHLNGTTISFQDQNGASASTKTHRESGGGAGAQAGWGFTKWLMVYAGVDAARVDIEDMPGVEVGTAEPNYTLLHGDIGVRFSFPNPTHGFEPYLNAAYTARGAIAQFENEDVSISGDGVSVGAGLQYFFNPKWALDVGLQLSTGDFTNVEFKGVKVDLNELGVDIKTTNSARLNVGMKFYPHFGKY